MLIMCRLLGRPLVHSAFFIGVFFFFSSRRRHTRSDRDWSSGALPISGVATLWTLPNKLGEFYATVVNGPGYTSRETDRFKDYAARLSITPLSGSTNKVIKTFALTGWTYVGAVASSFAAGGAGQVGAVGSSLPRRR